MDREKAKALLPIIEAYANGETVQFLDGERWREGTQLDWSFPPQSYRIAPKPRTFYGITYKHTSTITTYDTEEMRDNVYAGYSNRMKEGDEKITLVEVLES